MRKHSRAERKKRPEEQGADIYYATAWNDHLLNLLVIVKRANWPGAAAANFRWRSPAEVASFFERGASNVVMFQAGALSFFRADGYTNITLKLGASSTSARDLIDKSDAPVIVTISTGSCQRALFYSKTPDASCASSIVRCDLLGYRPLFSVGLRGCCSTGRQSDFSLLSCHLCVRFSSLLIISAQTIARGHNNVSFV